MNKYIDLRNTLSYNEQMHTMEFSRPMKILVIEDEKETREFLHIGLQEEGYVVDVCGDGEQGSAKARTNAYDCVILDQRLPKKDGFTVCQEMRDEHINTPIIILSVNSEIPQKVELLNNGADDYLSKPFSFSELLARINALLRRSAPMREVRLIAGDLELDRDRQLLLRDKKEIYLTKKEFTLLEYLMQNKGRVVSRSKILEHVWEADANPFSNTIEAHILRLRKKVEAGKRKIIRNVPGRGYKIEV